MIPLRLSLKNFLSYQQASLDFQGLHTACICGPNGAGKSSLLEAMTWALWGQSRGVTEDDVIHMGEREAQVELIFQSQQQIYRVIRSRQRKQSTVLEFQIAQGETTGQGFRTLTEKGLRATQQKIIATLKLDYETFINCAYLRQGRADEFMLKRPNERKQVLADLLKLDQYDLLAERAKERSREFKTKASLLEQNLQLLSQQLQQRETIEQAVQTLQTSLTTLQQQQERDRARLQHLQQQQQQRQTWQQTVEFKQQQWQRLGEEGQRLGQTLETVQQQQQALEALLAQAQEILQGYSYWQGLQQQEEEWTQRAKAYQVAQEQRSKLQEQLDRQRRELHSQREKVQTQLEQLDQQRQDLQQTLQKKPDVESALVKLQQTRDRLQQLDQLQIQVVPLMHRRSELQRHLEQIKTRIRTHLEELYNTSRHLKNQQAQESGLQQALEAVNQQLGDLEQRKQYLEQLREKGLERRSFLERLHAHQRDYETQLAELEQKAKLLSEPGMPCPLCARPLEGHHWDLAQQQHQSDRQEALDMLWVVKDQLGVSDREIQVLRQEYRSVEKELEAYGQILERRGQLQQQLIMSSEAESRLHQLGSEIAELEAVLQTEAFEPGLHQELRQIEKTLEELAYDDRTHALARGETERWRWAEIKQAEIRVAERQQAQVEQRYPELQTQIAALQQQLEALAIGSLQQQISGLNQHLVNIHYDLDRHQQLRQELRQAQYWQLRHQELTGAWQTHPQLQQQLTRLTQQLHQGQAEQAQLAAQINQLHQQLQQWPDLAQEIEVTRLQMQDCRQQLDQQLAELGRLQQQQHYLTNLQSQYEQQRQHQKTCSYQQQLHQELVQAFGKNGIQALLIENLLPQLESETNQILSRLSANQLHVQFITQRSRRTGNSDKLIDTLDIRIADAKGTRPYETYSGGEAFRVNFAIRLALARLLARRSGAALQLLIVDEGFGTQDGEGCDRLIAAINAIASDFACILTITHMPQFKEAFQTRIEVSKTNQGSKLTLAV
jgi:exonuclease SbcC